MRNIKKLGALLLAIVMCMGLSVTAFATTGSNYGITVNNAVAGHTYKLYKMMDLSTNIPDAALGEGGDKTTQYAYSYYVDTNSANPWYAFFTTGAGKDYVEFSEKGNVSLDGKTVRYVAGFKAGMDSPEKMIEFGQAAEAYAKTLGNADRTATLSAPEDDDADKNKVVSYTVTNKAGAEVKTGNTTASETGHYSKFTFEGLEPGYYLVVSSVGSNAIVGSTPDNRRPQVNEKNSVPTMTKDIDKINDKDTVDKDNGDAGIGDKITYKLDITVPGTVVTYTDAATGEVKSTGAENYVIHDLTSKALTLKHDSVVVKRGETVLINGTDYDLTFPTGDGAHCSMEIAFKEAFLNTVVADDHIVVTYDAMINKNAIGGTVGNTAYLAYGDGNAKTPGAGTGGDPTKDDVDPDPNPKDPPKPGVHVYEIDVYKYARTGTGNDATPLAGATFSLYKDGKADPIAFVKIEDSKHPRQMAAGTDAAKAVEADRYRVAEAGEPDSVTEIPTTAKGGLILQGLAAGKYTLRETNAPAGYNKLDKDIAVTINSVVKNSGGTFANPEYMLTIDGTGVDNASVQNAFGTQMPETGGIGTTILYIIGAVLVVGAVAFLVARKKAGDDDDAE